MTKEERKIRFDIALEMVEKVYSDYCHDPDINREQRGKFNDLVTDMIHFSTVLDAEAKEEAEQYKADLLSKMNISESQDQEQQGKMLVDNHMIRHGKRGR